MSSFHKLVEQTRNSKLLTSETSQRLIDENKQAARKLLVSMIASGLVSSMTEVKKEVKDK